MKEMGKMKEERKWKAGKENRWLSKAGAFPACIETTSKQSNFLFSWECLIL
jgi:hypothetical protein